MADKRISGLPAITSAAREDLLLVVDDPAGSPSNKKVSITNFFSNVEPEITFANTKALSNSSVAAAVFKGGVGIQDGLQVDGNVTINGTTTLNNFALSEISSNIVPSVDDTHSVGNSTVAWANGYIGVLNGNSSGNLVISATVNAACNVTFNGANTLIAANITFTGAEANVACNAEFRGEIVHILGSNLNITSNSTLGGTNTVVSSNATFTGANLKATGTNTHFSSNTSLGGTNTVISSNTTLSGANLTVSGSNTNISANVTFGGTKVSSTANVDFSGTNTHFTSTNVSSAGNTTLAGTNTVISSNVTASANVAITSAIDSSSNTTGALTVTGGAGISKSVTIGQNLNVHGNIHANGNITADGGTITFGDSDADTVQFNADLGGDLIPNANVTSNLGNTGQYYANAYVQDVIVSKNVTVTGTVTATGNVGGARGIFSDNVSIGTDKSLTFRDATLEINSPADGELEITSDDLITLTATSNVEVDSAVFNVKSNSTIAGTLTTVTSNATLSGANVVINGTNTALFATGLNIDGTLMNVKSNTDMTGIVTIGVDGAGKNLKFHSGTAGANVFLRADLDELQANVQIGNVQKVRSDGALQVSNDATIIFGGQFKLKANTTTEGFLLQEDATAAGSGSEGGRIDLETATTKFIKHNTSAGFVFNDIVVTTGLFASGATNSTSSSTGTITTNGGLGIGKSATIGNNLKVVNSLVVNDGFANAGFVGDGAGLIVVKNGTAPTLQGADQAYLYAKDDGSESHIYTMDEGGNETKLGPHNEEGEWEFYSRNTRTGKVMRVNMERMIRKLEEITGEQFIEEE